MVARKDKAITVDLYAPWARYRADLLRIDARCFGHRGSDEAAFETDVKEALLLAVIKEGDTAFGYCLVNRKWPKTAYIDFTAIEPDYQNKGHLGTLIGAVEDELRKCSYEFIERNCRIELGYADQVEKHYADRTVAKYDHESALGPLRFFRIALKKEPVANES